MNIRTHQISRSIALLAVLIAPAVIAGCSTLGYLGYLIAPAASRKTVKAEFAGLAGHNVVIVIFADQAVQYEYPYAQWELSSLIAEQLQTNVKGVKVVDSRRVIRYQEENIHWTSLDKTELGRAFGADYVLFVTLVEFNMREPGSVNLYRGRITAEASVYQSSLPERQSGVWRGEDLRVVFPKHAPVGEPGEDDSRIRYATQRELAVLLARKFYKHKVVESE